MTPTRTTDSLVLGVPTSDTRVQAVLEVSCDPKRRFDEHDLDALTAVAQLGGLVLEVARGRVSSRVRPAATVAPLIGSTSVMQALRARVERVAATDFTILIEGESGTGKELVARQVHELSRRRSGPFVAVNCAAVVETLLEAELFGIEERTATGVRGRRGKFEHADGGTLFLDEVSDLSLSAQAKLLRVIQDLAVERVGGQGIRRVNTRIVAATNRPLSELTVRGLFRTDLYYRLSGVEIHVAAASQPTRGHSRAGAALSRQASSRAGSHAVAAGGRGAQPARLARERPRTGTPDGAGRRARRSRIGSNLTTFPRPCAVSTRKRSGRHWPETSPSGDGEVAMPGWCSSGAVATSGGPAACSTSAITRSRRICATRIGAPVRRQRSCRPGSARRATLRRSIRECDP